METNFYVGVIDFGEASVEHILAANLAEEILRDSYHVFLSSKGQAGSVLKTSIKEEEGSVILIYVIPGIDISVIENLNEEFLEHAASEWKSVLESEKIDRIGKFAAAKLRAIELYLSKAGASHSGRCWMSVRDGCSLTQTNIDKLLHPSSLATIINLAERLLFSNARRLAVEYSSQAPASTTTLSKVFGKLRPKVYLVKSGTVQTN